MPIESVLIICNPISGRGQGRSNSEKIAKYLSINGFAVETVESKESYQRDNFSSFLKKFDLALVCGGDGTMLSLLESLSESRVPTYMIPVGNESLFAREFGMTRNANLIKESIKQNSIAEQYFASASDTSFFHMCSIGFDADVISHISSYRDAPLGYLGYLAPCLKTALFHKAPKLSVWADGNKVINEQNGYLIISNTKQYALKIRFNPEASSLSNSLHCLFVPYRSLCAFLCRSLRARNSDKRIFPNEKRFQARDIQVISDDLFVAQADGEYIGHTPLKAKSSGKTIRILEAKSS